MTKIRKYTWQQHEKKKKKTTCFLIAVLLCNSKSPSGNKYKYKHNTITGPHQAVPKNLVSVSVLCSSSLRFNFISLIYAIFISLISFLIFFILFRFLNFIALRFRHSSQKYKTKKSSIKRNIKTDSNSSRLTIQAGCSKQEKSF